MVVLWAKEKLPRPESHSRDMTRPSTEYLCQLNSAWSYLRQSRASTDPYDIRRSAPRAISPGRRVLPAAVGAEPRGSRRRGLRARTPRRLHAQRTQAAARDA